MAYLIERKSSTESAESADTLYPVEIPGHSKTQRTYIKPLRLYFTEAQLIELRANAAKAILKSRRDKKG
jgi:hypothetical protein